MQSQRPVRARRGLDADLGRSRGRSVALSRGRSRDLDHAFEEEGHLLLPHSACTDALEMAVVLVAVLLEVQAQIEQRTRKTTGTTLGIVVVFPPDHDIARAPAGVHSPVARLTGARGASSRAASFRRRDRLCDGRVDVGGAHVICARQAVRGSTVRNKPDLRAAVARCWNCDIVSPGCGGVSRALSLRSDRRLRGRGRRVSPGREVLRSGRSCPRPGVHRRARSRKGGAWVR